MKRLFVLASMLVLLTVMVSSVARANSDPDDPDPKTSSAVSVMNSDPEDPIPVVRAAVSVSNTDPDYILDIVEPPIDAVTHYVRPHVAIPSALDPERSRSGPVTKAQARLRVYINAGTFHRDHTPNPHSRACTEGDGLLHSQRAESRPEGATPSRKPERPRRRHPHANQPRLPAASMTSFHRQLRSVVSVRWLRQPVLPLRRQDTAGCGRRDQVALSGAGVPEGADDGRAP